MNAILSDGSYLVQSRQATSVESIGQEESLCKPRQADEACDVSVFDHAEPSNELRGM